MVCRADTIAPVFEECTQLRLCHLSGDAIFQSRNDVEDMGLALPGHIRMKPEGQPNLGVVIHDVGPGWHNANDFVGAALDFHLLSNERSLSKCCSPQFVGENCGEQHLDNDRSLDKRWKSRAAPTKSLALCHPGPTSWITTPRFGCPSGFIRIWPGNARPMSSTSLRD